MFHINMVCSHVLEHSQNSGEAHSTKSTTRAHVSKSSGVAEMAAQCVLLVSE